MVLSARPGRVKHIVAAGLERPRRLGIKRTAAFHAIEDRIWSLIHDEVLTSMRAERGLPGPRGPGRSGDPEIVD